MFSLEFTPTRAALLLLAALVLVAVLFAMDADFVVAGFRYQA